MRTTWPIRAPYSDFGPQILLGPQKSVVSVFRGVDGVARDIPSCKFTLRREKKRQRQKLALLSHAFERRRFVAAAAGVVV